MVHNNGVELIGKVQPDYRIKVLTSWDLGPNVGELLKSSKLGKRVLISGGRVDYQVADAVVDVTHRYKELFY